MSENSAWLSLFQLGSALSRGLQAQELHLSDLSGKVSSEAVLHLLKERQGGDLCEDLRRPFLFGPRNPKQIWNVNFSFGLGVMINFTKDQYHR